MAYYIGIDLGTTNSAIATFDGEKTRVWKAKDQTDVTPSCIFIDKKGRTFYGNKAYKALNQHEDRVAHKFKRFMGTSTPIKFAGQSMSPEECSAEILRELFRCLPEEISHADDRYTVITVPAAFDQMQNEATKKAAEMANIGKVAVMQEPVAAIMSVMNSSEIKNGTFLIFDMGGGTLDVAIANCVNGKVDVIAHGGIAMCGGADIDTRIVSNIIMPWLLSNEDYDIPSNFMEIPKYRKLIRRAGYLAEEAKIELSSSETADIYGPLGPDIVDENDDEIELDITITREQVNGLMKDLLDSAVECARDTINKSGISATSFERIVFIGGPTNYKPLRDYVTKELGIRSNGLEVNPMTAVAEGAAIYAEAIDWNSVEHERKNSNSVMESAESLGLKFKYEARTTKDKARLAVLMSANVTGYTLQIRSVDTGWDSGMLALKNKTMIMLPLAKKGENKFEVTILDEYDRKIPLDEDTITITKTISSIGSVLASYTLGVEVKANSLSNDTELDVLVHEGDKLPVSGKKVYKATEKIKAGDDASINFKLWQGNITSKISDNKYVGCLKIEGTDLDYGAIRPDDEIIFEYTINEGGSFNVTVNLTRLDITVDSNKNFYAATEGQKDMSSEQAIEEVIDDGKQLSNRADTLRETIDDPRIAEVERIASNAQALDDDAVIDPEKVKKNSDEIIRAKKLLDDIRNDNLVTVRKSELNNLREEYVSSVEKYATPAEKQEFSNAFNNLQSLLGRKDGEFESIIEDLHGRFFSIEFQRSKEFLAGLFNYLRERPFLFEDSTMYHKFVNAGIKLVNDDRYDDLRGLIIFVIQKGISRNSGDTLSSIATNIIRG